MENQLPEESSSTLKWQNRAFPLMVGAICFFSLFFIIASAVQLYGIRSKIEYTADINLPAITNISEATSQLELDQLTLQTKAQLESYALNRRYHQSNMLLISRVWIQYLGFLIGTILVLIGAIFVLGKMREGSSKFDSEIKDIGKLAFNSSSPGLFLVLFGTVIIAITLFYHPKITVQDGSLYFDKTYNLNTSNKDKDDIMSSEEMLKENIKDITDSLIPPPPKIQ